MLVQQPVVVFKPSCLCSINHYARREVEQFAAAGSFPIYNVQIARPLSDAIGQRLGTAHALPQGYCKYIYAFHDAITYATLSEAAQCWHSILALHKLYRLSKATGPTNP
ncbi:monothiol bacilliredoxin BrxC family protein [Rhodothermus bifroesti]|uniref:monothiol bacilliredoxin BrxC family protein n=1 Tax=Rhodothermus bifroesti TaxID=2823335 RepID=UPI001AEF525F